MTTYIITSSSASWIISFKITLFDAERAKWSGQPSRLEKLQRFQEGGPAQQLFAAGPLVAVLGPGDESDGLGDQSRKKQPKQWVMTILLSVETQV